MNEQYGSAAYAKTATDRPLYGYESALDRLADQRSRLEEQVARLRNMLGPVLEGEVPQIDKANNGSAPGYATQLLQDINRQADNFADVANRLESVIARIRL